ncbi:MAG TPA: hypothetical protein VEK57_17645 [Thermoanaerobaculia bacterium]|nr:hypothetical protein [Thermoanaerobaculia bacterium]
MIISVINQTNGEISDPDLLAAIRAINQQIEYDFVPYWNMPATLRLEGTLLKQPRANASAAVMRGDAVLYVSSATAKGDPEGFHDRNFRGIPYGVVYSEISEQTGDPWSVTFSHEALELIADPQANNYVMGPAPHDRRKKVFFWFEMCDAVSSQTYKIGDIALQNFVLPAYFEPPVPGARTNFLGTELEPFGIASESYVGYYDPAKQSQETAHVDVKGKARHEIRKKLGHTRSHRRHEG